MSGPYTIIYADPPWTYRDTADAGNRGASHKYPCMTVEQLCAMSPFIQPLIGEECLLAMWWVPPMPGAALAVVDAWGFKLVTMKGFTWHKRTRHGRSHFGMGSYTRANTEDCLFAVPKRGGRARRVSAGVPQFMSKPKGRHSEKPHEARLRLVQLLGDVPRIELFARERVPGWDAWGNEIPILAPEITFVSANVQSFAARSVRFVYADEMDLFP